MSPAAKTTKTTKKAAAAKKKPAAKTSKNGAAPDKEKKSTRGVSRPAWQGSISFGLIHFPVKLFGVSKSKRIAFNQLHAKDGSRIKQKRFCAAEDKEVPFEEIVKGYEVEPGQYVIIEPSELDALAPERSKTIELEKFIDAEQIDPLFYDASYFVLPGEGAGAPYALLREAMIKEDRAAIARLVMRGKEHLVALWPRGDTLVISTMHFADEVADPEKFEAEDPPSKARADVELKAARQLVSALTDDFDITDYKDEYREEVLKLIEAKAKGKKIAVAPTEEAATTPAKDLMAALEESLASLSSAPSAGGRKRGSRGSHKSAKH